MSALPFDCSSRSDRQGNPDQRFDEMPDHQLFDLTLGVLICGGQCIRVAYTRQGALGAILRRFFDWPVTVLSRHSLILVRHLNLIPDMESELTQSRQRP